MRKPFAAPLAFLGSMAFAALAQAAPVLIDFSNYPNTGQHVTVSSAGFDFNAAAGPLAISANGNNCSPVCAANGSSAFVVGAPSLTPATVSPVTMSTVLFTSFRLVGLDYAELSRNANTHLSASTIEVLGFLQGGGTISQTLVVDGLNDGPGGNTDFETATLDAIWATSQLVSLQFAGQHGAQQNRGFQLDNIALEATRTVAEPSALALTGLALLVAGRTRRRRHEAHVSGGAAGQRCS